MNKRSELLVRNWEAAKTDLVDAANKAGIDPAVMAKMAGLESSFDAAARPISRDDTRNTVTQYDGTKAMSSAHGYGQLTNDTWVTMVHRYGEKYGIKGAASLTAAEANMPAYREDKALQAGMFAELTRENIAAIGDKGGGDIAANIYAYHNLGQRTGATFLDSIQNNPYARVDTILSRDVIKGNTALYGEGNISVADAYQRMSDMLAVYEAYAAEVRLTPMEQHSGSTGGPAPDGSVKRRLRQGDRGSDVGSLQYDLNALGYTDGRNASLRPDNVFGASTAAAVEAFQRDNCLAADGVVGSATRKAIEDQVNARMQGFATQPPARLDDPGHPDHALFQQACSHVHRLDEKLGRSPDQLSENIASALTVSARSSGLSRIDLILLSDDGSRLWAVQRPRGVQHSYMDLYASVPTSAANDSMDHSGAQWPQAMQQFQQGQERAIHKPQSHPGLEQAVQQATPAPGSLSK